MEFIRDFGKLGKNDAALAGGKGASLGEMTQAGIPVPSGFVILANAFEQFLKETDLNVEIDAALHSVNHREMHTVEHASEKIQKLILEAKMPHDIAEEIKISFKKLGADYVAVRSSATAEDSASAAWAGQLDSFLNTEEENLLENVKKCWASLFTPRAIFYRFEKDLHRQKISVAVVVQKMVESDVSGIAFSVHPVTQDRNQLIIEAGFGLGEAIVSGQITPDSYVVEKEPRRIIDINVNTQAKALHRSVKGGNEWITILEPKASSQVLNETQILELSQIVLIIENHYGFSCDIEWAFEKGKFYILQSRPITTLSTSAQDDFNVHRKWQVFRSRYIPAMLPILSYWSWPVKDVVGKEVGLVVNVWDKGYYQAIWEEKGYQAVRDYSLNFLLSHVRSLRDIRKQGIKAGQKVVDACKEFAIKVDSVTIADFATFLGFLDKTYNEFTRQSMLLWLFSGEAIQAEIKKELPEISDEEQNKIFSAMSIPNEKLYSQEEEEKFWKIVGLARNQGIDSSIVGKAIKKFSEEYFWFPYEYVGPRVWDVPTVRKRVIDALSFDAVEHATELQHEVDIKITEKAEKFFAVLRAVALMQDDRKMLNAQICYYLNNVILGALAKRLDIALEDMRYLESNLLDLLANESFDKTAVREELKNRSVFCVVIQDAEKYEVYSDQAAKEKLKELGIQEEVYTTGEALHGQSAYKGKVTGRVKILHSSSEGQNFPEGDILVTGMTTPDFVPIIKKASAIITDERGITSHAAIISRELKIPCVIGTKSATRVLKDGDLVEVNADKGVVKIIL